MFLDGDMSIDIEDLGSVVFEELAFDCLGYNPFLAKAKVVDYCWLGGDTQTVILAVNELGKLPYRVEFEVKIKGFRRFKEDE